MHSSKADAPHDLTADGGGHGRPFPEASPSQKGTPPDAAAAGAPSAAEDAIRDVERVFNEPGPIQQLQQLISGMLMQPLLVTAQAMPVKHLLKFHSMEVSSA